MLMAKQHKHAWNGLDLETSLPIETLANMAQRAALESTGDLVRGKFRIVSTSSTDRAIEFRINDFLISFKKLMVFSLNFEQRGGRTFASTSIDWYVTTQSTVAFIPVSTKSMVAHHTFMQFVYNLAAQVQQADATARVTVREGAQAALAAPAPAPPEESGPQQTDHQAAPSPAAAPVPPPPPPPPPAEAAVSSARPPAPPPPPPVMPARPASLAHAPARSGLVTGIPGSAAAPTAATPAPPPPPPPPPEDDEGDDLDVTRMSAATPIGSAWVIAMPDGRVLPLEGGAALGRSPVAPPIAPSAAAIAVDDPKKSVSKTHALLSVDGDVLRVTDLHSTNGTSVRGAGGETTSCPPGVAVAVADGNEVSIGEFRMIVRRE